MISAAGKNPPIVIATQNKKKQLELESILEGRAKVYTLDRLAEEFGRVDTPISWIEDKPDFRGNASVKVDAISKHLRILSENHDSFPNFGILADDSGLCVEVLGGAPGVRSARFAGERASDSENIDRLLNDLKGHSNRGAYFTCTIAYFCPKKQTIQFFEGRSPGKILEVPRGKGGFGYDPIFLPDGYLLAFSELTADAKNKISHRGLALEKWKAFYDSE